MWFWMVIIVFVIGIGLIVAEDLIDIDTAIVGWFVSILSGLTALIMLICIIISHTNVEAGLEQEREIYEALTYKMESTTCRDEFGFLSKEVIDEVQEWNKDVRYYQSAQDDFWVGIFYPNVYDEFETIDYETYNNG